MEDRRISRILERIDLYVQRQTLQQSTKMWIEVKYYNEIIIISRVFLC